jgi:hypothetical protein
VDTTHGLCSRLAAAAGGGAANPQRLPDLQDPERFAICHHSGMNETLSLGLRRPRSESSFRSYFHQVNVATLWNALRDSTIPQIPGDAADIALIVCGRWWLDVHCPDNAVLTARGKTINHDCYTPGETASEQ